MELRKYLEQFKEFSPEMIMEINSAFDSEEYPKGYKLLLPDNRSDKVFFIEKGLARIYYLKDGKDITHYFFKENSFSAPIESIFYNKPSPYGLELLEPSVVRTKNYADLQKYIDNSSAVERLIRILLLDALSEFSDRLQAIQFQSAQERYSTMLEKYPNIFSRAPLGHIASYIGITQETLSRIRAGK
jgi:CRP-like cAMP-binding protein